MSYLRGEKFDPAGMVLVLIWSDGSREEITKGYSIVGGDKPLTLNNRTVTIQYEGLSTVLNVTVNKPAIEPSRWKRCPQSRITVPEIRMCRQDL